MIALRPSILVLAGLSLLAAAPLSAKTASPRPLLLDSRTEDPSEVRLDRRIDSRTGIARAIYAPNAVVQPGEPEAMAREYLHDHRAELGIEDPELGELVHRHTRRGLVGTTVRFDQRASGLPVYKSEVTVTIDKQNRVLFVMNGLHPQLSSIDTTPVISAADARSSALARLGVEGDLAYDRTTLLLVPQDDTARLAYQVKVVPRVAPPGDWEVLVDARTGEIFQVVDDACYVDGTGNVFDADPLSSAHATYGSAGFTDGNDATTAQLDGQLQSKTLRDITFSAGTYSLVGPYAAIVDTESPFNGLFGQATSTFAYNRFQNQFEAANCYYHIDRTMRFINETLGIVLTPDEYAGGVRFDPHGLSGADNSHYTPSIGVVAFGEGGVDDAEDSDVVIHELGHGIHDWITNGGLSQVDGLSEGVGDYFAQSYSRSLGQWASNEAQYNWTFSWDGHNPFWSGRITNYSATYPGGLVGQIHTDGQIWATCLMRIWNQVGRNKADAAHIEGLGMTNASASQNDAANAVAQAAVALGYTPSEINTFATEFQTTGYSVNTNLDLVSHSGVDDCSGVTLAGPGDGLRAGGDGLWEPGETVQVQAILRSSLLTRTNVVGTLTTSTPGVTIVDGTATWPTLLPGVATPTDSPYFTIEIADTVPCYSTMAFTLTVTTSQSGPHVYNFSHSVGASLTPLGLPVAIPNNNAIGVTSTLDVGQALALTDLDVHVQINHNWVGDVKIQLQSPAGTIVTLLDRPGFPPANGCNNDNMDVTFDSASSFNLETHCAGTVPWYSGVAAPFQSLNVFNGESTVGTWKLIVIDAVAGGSGSLIDWDLLTTPALSSACEVCESTGAPIVSGSGTVFSLEPSRPNPFSGQTEIHFSLGRTGPATLRVFDVGGRHVATLADGNLEAGAHTRTWNGTDASGHAVAGGIYFYRLTSDEGTKIARMQLVR